MTYQPYYITQYEQDTGLENYFQSFLLPEKAFTNLQDAYCWRGQVKRRGGVFLLGRLQRILLNKKLALQALGAAYAVADLLNDPGIDVRAPAVGLSEPNASIVPGSLGIDVGALTFVDDSLGGLDAGGGNIGTINYITGALTLTFVPPLGGLTDVVVSFNYCPALPVMGLRLYEVPAANFKFLIAFDQKYAYEYNYLSFEFDELPSVAATTWTGNDADLFWTTNYNITGAPNPIFWATNFNGAAPWDPIRYYDGTTWTDFAPVIDAGGNILHSCLALLPFKNCLLVFNTWEGGLATSINYPQRIRWNAPLSDPTNVAFWLPPPGVGEAGFLDVPTDEPIVSVEYLKDVILIKCNNSSWKLVYTGDQAFPFAVQKINTEFGASSTFSLVPFDDGVYCIGYRGITTDDTTAVERIDLKIPDDYLDIEPAPFRAYGIRDYTNELVYWANTIRELNIDIASPYPANPSYNNNVLVFNYRNNSYARFIDSYTCFGTFYIDEPIGFPPSIAPSSNNVIAGNQQGFVEIMNAQIVNSASLAITNVTPGAIVTITVPNHNFNTVDYDYWVQINDIIATGPNPASALNYAISGKIYHLSNTPPGDPDNFDLETWDATTNTFVPVPLGAGGTYRGGGTITIMQNFDIKTKFFSPFYEQGQQNLVPYIDFFLNRTASGQFSSLVYLNENNATTADAVNNPLVAANQGLLGDNRILSFPENAGLYPFQARQAKIWHRFFSPYISQNFQLELTMNPAQMSSFTVNNNDFVLHAMTLYLSPNARMTQ